MLTLSKHEKSLILQLLKQHFPTAEYRCFGSRVNGTHQPYSDLDIAIISAQPLPLAAWSEADEAFADSDLAYKIDLVDYARVSPEFQQHINTSSVPLQ